MSTVLTKAGHILHIVRFGMAVQSLILLLNGIGVGKEDPITEIGAQRQILVLLMNGAVVRKESHTQGIDQAGVELLMPICPLTAKRIRENAGRKGVIEPTCLTLILVIMNTRKNIHPVVEDHLIKTEVESILNTAGTEEKTLHNVLE